LIFIEAWSKPAVDMNYSYLAKMSESGPLHFGWSAKALHMSQSALSLHIKALEEDIKTKLLERDCGGVALTEAEMIFRDNATIAPRPVISSALTKDQPS
jgi:DNA-binding transcriptional ArsR family regulator